jgi:hypothetical protein
MDKYLSAWQLWFVSTKISEKCEILSAVAKTVCRLYALIQLRLQSLRWPFKYSVFQFTSVPQLPSFIFSTLISPYANFLITWMSLTFMSPCIVTNFLVIKPTRCINFSNLFWKWNSTCFGQFLCPSSGVIHSTLSNGIWHTGL